MKRQTNYSKERSGRETKELQSGEIGEKRKAQEKIQRCNGTIENDAAGKRMKNGKGCVYGTE